MSKKFVSASIDTSVYESFPTFNVGHDEVLDVGKVTRTIDSYQAARSLIKFEIPNDIPISASAFLHLRIANAQNLRGTETIEVYPISSSWIEGTGYFNQSPYNADDGATWIRSSTAASWSVAGVDFIPSLNASYPLNQQPLTDIRLDVTDIYQSWVSGSTIPNHGFLIKFDDASEDDVLNRGNVKIFSRNTHTIYQPLLEFAWIDQSISTGSLIEPTSSLLEVAPRDLKTEYRVGEVRKLYFNVREKYPAKTFTTRQRYGNKFYLPVDTQYEIKDVQSGLSIISFDQYSVLNTDPNGTYLLLDTYPLERLRFYDLRIKVSIGDEVVIFGPWRFKVV